MKTNGISRLAVILGSTEKDRDFLDRFVIHAKGRHVKEQLTLVASEPWS